MKNLFEIQPHTRADKEFMVFGPVNFIIDYDDVDHQEVDSLIETVVGVLNQNSDQF